MVLAIDKHRDHAERRGRRKVEMLRVADVHRFAHCYTGARKCGVIELAPRLGDSRPLRKL